MSTSDLQDLPPGTIITPIATVVPPPPTLRRASVEALTVLSMIVSQCKGGGSYGNNNSGPDSETVTRAKAAVETLREALSE